MRTKLIAILTLTAMIAVACNKEDSGPGTPPEEGKGLVNIVIKNPIEARSSGGATEDPVGSELTIDPADGLKVFVFNQNGALEYSTGAGRLTLTPNGADYVSNAFEISTGPKNFFIFLNDGTANGKVVAPGTGTVANVFMRSAFDVAITADVPDIAETKFLMGTLWRGEVNAVAGGTTTSPQQIELEVGRFASKINLNEVNYDVSGTATLLGTFSDAKYRLGTIPKKISNVGVHIGNSLPTVAAGVMVESAVHDTGILTGSSDPNYLQYMTTWKTPTESYYAVENTTEKNATTQNQYYGNTTYIQLETVYTPDPAEVYDPTDLSTGHTINTGDTFWTAKIVDDPEDFPLLAGQTIILNAIPQSGTTHRDIAVEPSYPEYTGGKNYHKFPVFDDGETGNEYKNRVLRNHYYEFTVTEFNGLGSDTDEVDPGEPIPDKTTVNILVKVKKWDKVTGSTPVG